MVAKHRAHNIKSKRRRKEHPYTYYSTYVLYIVGISKVRTKGKLRLSLR